MNRKLYFVGYVVMNLLLISFIFYYANELSANPCEVCEKNGYNCRPSGFVIEKVDVGEFNVSEILQKKDLNIRLS